MESKYTQEDVVAAARFVREQAPRLPHPQRHAALMMAKLFEGVDIGPKMHPEFGDVGGALYLSIPVNWGDTLLGSVDFGIHRNESPSGGEEWHPVYVAPMFEDYYTPIQEPGGGESMYSKLVKEEGDNVVDFPSPDIGLGDPNEVTTGESRINPNSDEIFVRVDDMSTKDFVTAAWPDGSNQIVISAENWDNWPMYEEGQK